MSGTKRRVTWCSLRAIFFGGTMVKFGLNGCGYSYLGTGSLLSCLGCPLHYIGLERLWNSR